MYKFVNSIDKCFGTRCDNVGIGREAIVTVAIVFNSHVNFTDVIAALIDCLNQEFFYGHVTANNEFDC